ncbi:hypothetical protein HBI59_049380 [Parastagonospora nodorum]|nr:hypothetical protein HBI59_049380 [Parastagonospora nodorum]
MHALVPTHILTPSWIIKLRATCHHPRLRRLRCLNAIVRNSFCRWLGCSRRPANQSNAYMYACLHLGTVTPNASIPFQEVCKADMLLAYDLVANWSPCLTECVVESERRYLEEWLHSLTRLQSRARLPILGDKHKPLSSLRGT